MPRLSRPSILALGLVLALGGAAQTFRMDWHTVDNGGGTSTGGPYVLSGTVGQPDASILPATGVDYVLEGGFWPGWILPAVGDLPPLFIRHTPEGVILSWSTESPGVLLQETEDLLNGLWIPSSAVNGVLFLPGEQPRFYRLRR